VAEEDLAAEEDEEEEEEEAIPLPPLACLPFSPFGC